LAGSRGLPSPVLSVLMDWMPCSVRSWGAFGVDATLHGWSLIQRRVRQRSEQNAAPGVLGKKGRVHSTHARRIGWKIRAWVAPHAASRHSFLQKRLVARFGWKGVPQYSQSLSVFIGRTWRELPGQAGWPRSAPGWFRRHSPADLQLASMEGGVRGYRR